ncbi:MAG: glycosyltransferase family 39 protein [Acidobacteriaceae bacterium]
MSTVVANPSQTSRRVGEQESSGPLFRWILPLLGVGSLLASCILWSLRKPMWGDEVFTVTELRDPSLLHLLHAVPRLGGAGMPLFYLTAWPWAHVFGLSDLSLRLYSSVAVCGAFLILLAAMRRRFSDSAAFLGVAFGLFASLIVLDQNSEARGYGLYLLLCALAVAQALKVAEEESPRTRDLILLALTQAGLVFGHILGLVYAGLILLALLAVDLGQRRFRTRVYLACIAGWLALVPWIPAIQASAAVGRPHGWINVPTLGDLAASLSFWLFTGLYWQVPHVPAAIVGAGWLCAVACVGVLILASVQGIKTSPAQRPVYLLGFALLLGPAAFFVVSHLAAPIFLPRYLIPSALGICILASAWAARSRAGNGTAVTILSCAVLLLPIATALLAHPTGLNVAWVDQIAAGRTVVCDSLKDFMVMTRYSDQPGRVEYPLDEAAASTVPGVDTDVRLLKNYRREGYLVENLPDPAQILSRKSFLVLDNTGAPWFPLVIEHNPRFAWKVLAQVDSARRLIEVNQQP